MTEIIYSNGVQKYIKKGKAMSGAAAEHRATMRAKKFDTIAVHGLYNMQAALANQGQHYRTGLSQLGPTF